MALARHILMLIVLSAMFSAAYVRSAHIDPQSRVRPTTSPEVSPLFRARVLMPAILRHVVADRWLDTQAMRAGLAFVFVLAALCLARPYARAVGSDDAVAAAMPLSLLAVMVCHYCLPRLLNVYYVYDMPSIVFYMIAMLLLTDRRAPVFALGLVSVLVFAFSRETISVAPFHAAGLLAGRGAGGRTAARMGLLAAALAGVVAVRLALVHLAGGGPGDSVSFHEMGVLRPVAYWHRVLHEPGAACQVLLFGCGAVLWIVPALLRASPSEKRLAAASAIPLVLLMSAGNFIELRIYGELVPLLGLLLAGSMVRPARGAVGRHH